MEWQASPNSYVQAVGAASVVVVRGVVTAPPRHVYTMPIDRDR